LKKHTGKENGLEKGGKEEKNIKNRGPEGKAASRSQGEKQSKHLQAASHQKITAEKGINARTQREQVVGRQGEKRSPETHRTHQKITKKNRVKRKVTSCDQALPEGREILCITCTKRSKNTHGGGHQKTRQFPEATNQGGEILGGPKKLANDCSIHRVRTKKGKNGANTPPLKRG